MHYGLTQALLAGKVAATTGMMRNFELIQLELAKHPGLAFYPEQNGVPAYSELIFVAHKDHIHEKQYRHFLRALEKGLQYLQSHPQESWNMFAKAHPELDDELNHRAWYVTLSYFTKHAATFDENAWRQFAKFMFKQHLINKVQPMNRYAVDLFAVMPAASEASKVASRDAD